VALSGGVDSALLTAIAASELGPRAAAGTIHGSLSPVGEVELARVLADGLGVRHVVVELDPLSDEGVASNPPDRCYHCKLVVFSALRKVAEELGLQHVAHGEHAGDMTDFRPGRRAAAELGIIAPLADAGLNKDDVRKLSRALGLPGWDRPSMACLASRVPYGERLTADLLGRIGAAEAGLRELGLEQIRVRSHGSIARIEVLEADLARLADAQWRRRVVAAVLEAGYTYVTVDLQGFRTGSMNEVL
jgi:uncharacterized protein